MPSHENPAKARFLTTQRLLLLTVIMAIIAGLWAADVSQYLSYQGLVDNEAALKQAVAGAPLVAALADMGVDVLGVAFFFARAGLVWVGRGVMFGTWQGGLLIVTSATIGASLLFLAARYLIGDVLRARAGPALQKFEQSFNRDAVSYLLAMRLLPVFPFFIVNLGASLVGVRFGIFVATTFIGIIPGTFVFASIGNGISVVLQEGAQPNLSVVTRPEIILPLAGLAILSLLPVVWRRLSPNRQNTDAHGQS